MTLQLHQEGLVSTGAVLNNAMLVAAGKLIAKGRPAPYAGRCLINEAISDE